MWSDRVHTPSWRVKKKIIFKISHIPLAYNGFDFSYNLKIIKYFKDACTVTYHIDRHLSIKHPFWKLFCRKIHFPGLWLALPIAYKLSNLKPCYCKISTTWNLTLKWNVNSHPKMIHCWKKTRTIKQILQDIWK